jgi:hypothetical protein
MIEIFADEFNNGSILQEHVYLDESKISLVSSLHFYEKLKKLGDKYIDVWRFSIVIDGCSQSFYYVKKDACEFYYNMVLNLFISLNQDTN